jgi:hypothetical protein
MTTRHIAGALLIMTGFAGLAAFTYVIFAETGFARRLIELIDVPRMIVWLGASMALTGFGTWVAVAPVSPREGLQAFEDDHPAEPVARP